VNVDANKALIRRFYEEVWARGNVGFSEEVFADHYVRHDLRPTKAAQGAAGQASIAEQFRSAFPDLEWRVDLVLGDGDLVAARWTASGTHSGAWGEVAPTGRRATFSGVKPSNPRTRCGSVPRVRLRMPRVPRCRFRPHLARSATAPWESRSSLAKLAVTSAKRDKRGELSVRYRSSQRIAAFSYFGDPRSA
jgi:predicted SnoaL-like aldol condensation-catalyzing enzyme